MKILQITNSLLSGGAEKLVVETSLLFKKKSTSVDILLLNGIDSPLKNKIEENQEIEIIALEQGNIYNPKYILRLKKHIKNYDLIHVHLFPSIYWVAIASILNRNKIPLIMTEHNSSNRRRRWFLFKILDRILYKKYHSIITISDAVDKNLRHHLGKGFKNLKQIHNGIPLQAYNNAQAYKKSELGVEESDHLIIQVASFTKQKDQNTLIKSMSHVPESVKLILVGDGPLKVHSIKLTQELQLEDRVIFLGIRSDVPKLLKSVDLVVLSSHFEGLSLSSIEGMASGKPFIASNVPGLTEVVKDAGVLFENGNFNQLAYIIKQLLSDSPYYQLVAKACLERSKQFSIDIMVDKYLSVYRSALEKE
ncbi:glycosyltransferase [Galbibacter sp. EGI 63066]|uniref:glycosyltransferase n=1 Tax=Galbibacter sp. EGI 63066 TaxID=2993559 RepID=UPI002248AE04|nr:glycosyltransferase [Galbibacter sp. EGI 63066]MCX2679172.1 glycosyltransferase [Galbibacter sp. EGI 63066]